MIYYRKFPRADQKAAVVISSGRTECMFKYDETIYDLFQDGYSVYIHDHRGQGYSSPTTGRGKHPEHGHGPGHVERFEYYVEDLNQFLNEVVRPEQRELTGRDDNLLLLGHSMGGCIASLYIEKYPRVFRGVALCAPMHEPNVGLLPGIAVETIAGLRRLKGQPEKYAGQGGPYNELPFDERTMKKEALTHSPKRYRRVRRMFARHKETRVGGASYGWVHEALNAADRCIDNANKIQIPVLLLQATEDIAVTSSGQLQFSQALNAAHPNRCRLQPIRGGYHELLVESDEYRDPAVSLIKEFFAKHALGGN
jgi:lysophospholipase